MVDFMVRRICQIIGLDFGDSSRSATVSIQGLVCLVVPTLKVKCRDL